MELRESIQLGGLEFSIETGKIAKQADGAVIVRYDAAMAHTGGAAVTTRRFEAREPADGTADTVAPAINAAANRVAMDVAQWVAGT